MKKKNLWLAVATLVLCLGVMATGIYAVKTALLKVGGTLGFNMHECIVEVSGTIYNLAEKDVQSGTYKKVNRTISNAIMGGEKSDTVTTTNLDLGALEFYKGENIIFELTFKNLSSHSVIASFIMDEITGVKTVESVIYDTLPAGKIVSVGGTTSLTFALQLTDEEAYRDTTSPFNLEANFEEFELGYDSTNGSYIEMGEYTNSDNKIVPLRWFPFAYSSDGTTFSAHTLSTNQLASGTYYFISEYILNGSVSFREGNVDGANARGYTGTIDNHYGLDYNGSTIQKYVMGDMLTEFSISDDAVYKAITQRTLAGKNYEYFYAGENLTDPNVHITNETPNQSLWLLSTKEYQYLGSTENTVTSRYGYLLNSDSGGSWWLRTPTSVSVVTNENAFFPSNINSYMGYIHGTVQNIFSDSHYGVRPAFQITIC